MTNPELSNQENESVNMAALSPAQLADILGRASNSPLDIDQVLEDIEDGAPVDADGKLNMLTYAAWLAARVDSPKTKCD